MAEAKRRPEEERPEERRPHLREVKPEEEERRERLEKAEPPVSGLAIAGLALSVISLILPLIIAVVTAFLGAIFGGVALSQIRRGERTGSGLAWGALIIGVFVGVTALIFIGQAFVGAAGTQGSFLNNIGVL